MNCLIFLYAGNYTKFNLIYKYFDTEIILLTKAKKPVCYITLKREIKFFLYLNFNILQRYFQNYERF